MVAVWKQLVQTEITAAQKISEIYSSIMVRELIVSPHSENSALMLLKYREHLQKLYFLLYIYIYLMFNRID